MNCKLETMIAVELSEYLRESIHS